MATEEMKDYVIPASDLERFQAIEKAARAIAQADMGLISVRDPLIRELREALKAPQPTG